MDCRPFEPPSRNLARRAVRLAPFGYDLGVHELHQRFMGYDPPLAEEVLKIKQTILHRGLSVDDVTPANIRGGKLIDFDLMHFAAVPNKPRGVHRRGRVVSINSATVEELRALGPLIKWPSPETA